MTTMLPNALLFFLSATVVSAAAAAAAAAAIGIGTGPTEPESQPHGRRAIINGKDADPTRFPYYARLDNDGFIACGSSLIARDFVLTAAHCIENDFADRTLFEAVIGGHNYEIGTGLIRKAVDSFVHPDYSALVQCHDIALLKIEPVPEERLLPGGGIQILQLANETAKVGTSVEVIGMGMMIDLDGPGARVLQRADLTLISDADCAEAYDDGNHPDSMLCARGANGKSSCIGDSGGPIVVLGETPESDVQIGAVSFGVECATEFPEVFAEISYLRSWVDSTLCQHSAFAPLDCESTVVAGPVQQPSRQPTTVASDEDEGDGDGDDGGDDGGGGGGDDDDGGGGDCVDSPEKVYMDEWSEKQPCSWLEEEGYAADYCNPSHEAWIQCPNTCHGCRAEEEEEEEEEPGGGTNDCVDSSEKVYMDELNEKQSCSWLEEEGYAADYCNPSHEAWIQCPNTCHGCRTGGEENTAFSDNRQPEFEAVGSVNRSSSPTAATVSFVLGWSIVCAGMVGAGVVV